MINDLVKIAIVTVKFQVLLIKYVFFRKLYSSSISDDSNNEKNIIDKWANVQIYSLSLIFKMWSKPHYRSQNYQQDMIDNLKNVAVPGTGIRLFLLNN